MAEPNTFLKFLILVPILVNKNTSIPFGNHLGTRNDPNKDSEMPTVTVVATATKN